ncbi:MAG: ISNCY family transposase [bacterium]
MKFEEVYELRNEKNITVEEAARMLCMSERNLRRYIERYEEEGMDGLNDKRLAHAAHNAAPVDEVIRLAELYKCKYVGYSASHFYDKYRQHYKGQRSYNWVKRTLQQQGLMVCYKKKGTHRSKRPRQPMPGMMIHQDASTHQWVEGKYWDLVVTMDDATNEIYSAFFIEQEGTWSSFRGIKDVIETKGLFCSFYTDRGSHYWTTDKVGEKVNKIQLTQFGRAMKQLCIETIAAYSPEARGRSERMFGTLQMRLPLELKSAGITTMDDANRFLKHLFIPEFNRRFCVAPQIAKSAFVPWISGNIDLDDILCIQTQRIVNNDNTISYKGKTLQIPQNDFRYSYRKTSVKVNEYLDGSIAIFHGPMKLVKFKPLPLEKANPVDLWMSPSDRLASCGTCGKADGQLWEASCHTTLPHSPNSHPQVPQAQQ